MNEFCITRACTCIIPSTENKNGRKNKQKAEKIAGGVYRIEFGMVGRSGERVNICKTSAHEWAGDEYARMGWGRVRANGLGTSARE